jgi:hypothetical protein
MKEPKETSQWDVWEARAREMTTGGLRYSILDCIEAGQVAWENERAGCRVNKTQGHYSDEASVYRKELNRRLK